MQGGDDPTATASGCGARRQRRPEYRIHSIQLLSESAEKLHASGTELWLAALNPDVFQVLERTSLDKTLVENNRIFFNLEQAVEAYLAQQGSADGFRSKVMK
jgi:hypothetical protein